MATAFEDDPQQDCLEVAGLFSVTPHGFSIILIHGCLPKPFQLPESASIARLRSLRLHWMNMLRSLAMLLRDGTIKVGSVSVPNQTTISFDAQSLTKHKVSS